MLGDSWSELEPLRVVCTNVDQRLIADQRNFRTKYLQNSEENLTEK